MAANQGSNDGSDVAFMLGSAAVYIVVIGFIYSFLGIYGLVAAVFLCVMGSSSSQRRR